MEICAACRRLAVARDPPAPRPLKSPTTVSLGPHVTAWTAWAACSHFSWASASASVLSAESEDSTAGDLLLPDEPGVEGGQGHSAAISSASQPVATKVRNSSSKVREGWGPTTTCPAAPTGTVVAKDRGQDRSRLRRLRGVHARGTGRREEEDPKAEQAKAAVRCKLDLGSSPCSKHRQHDKAGVSG